MVRGTLRPSEDVEEERGEGGTDAKKSVEEAEEVPGRRRETVFTDQRRRTAMVLSWRSV